MKRRQLLAGFSALAALQALGGATKPAVAAEAARERLFGEFSKSAGFSANFVEEKRIQLLKQPVINHGRLYFASPALFARHVDKPFRSGIFLKERKVTLWDGKGTREMDLDQYPAVAAIATSFLSLLRGNRQELERNYQVTFEGSYDAWQLKLLPRGPELLRILRSLAFSGKQLILSEMQLVEASGDSSTSRFEAVDSDRKFTEAEKGRYFSVPKA